MISLIKLDDSRRILEVRAIGETLLKKRCFLRFFSCRAKSLFGDTGSRDIVLSTAIVWKDRGFKTTVGAPAELEL